MAIGEGSGKVIWNPYAGPNHHQNLFFRLVGPTITLSFNQIMQNH